MMNNYEEVIQWLESRLKFGIKPGLERMNWLMEELSHPEHRLQMIHVAGTNGKGSVVNDLRTVLQEAGYVVGTFTSPYLITFNERISVNGTPILDEDLVQAANIVFPLVEKLEQTELGAPTEFEIITAIALVYFARIAYPDIVIMETGLGGRLDSTNIISPILTLITNIGLDHTNILGDTIKEIATEKAGIMKNGVSLVTAVKQEEALDVIYEKAKKINSKVYELGKQYKIKDIRLTSDGAIFSYESLFSTRENIHLSMKGMHQVENAAMVIMAVDLLNYYYSLLIDDEELRRGLEKAFWPGRFEQLRKHPIVMIDGAHNLEGMDALVKTIQQQYPTQTIHTVFSALGDKPYEKMIHMIETISESIMFTTFDFPRAIPAKELASKSTHQNKASEENWQQAVTKTIEQAADDDVVLVTGSLYFISEVRKYLQ